MENLLLTQNLGRLWASLIINELVKIGCENFYLSPGLRNAPLIAAATNHPQVNIFVGIDERAQAFRALGYAKSTGKSAVLVCTSGTAMANYFPALIEAKKSQTPLVVLSADRPADLVYSGDNQTMRQDHLYGDYVLGHFNPGTPSLEISPSYLTTSISNLLNKGKFPTKGPVHLNCPFREPLDEQKREIPKDYIEKSYQALRNETKYINPDLLPPDIELKNLANSLESKRALLVIGPSENKGEGLIELVKKWNRPFFLDVCSGLKYQFNINDGALPSLDHPEVLKILSENPPEVILHLGGRLVSKHYYQFLKDYPEIELITINNQLDNEDPSNQTNLRFNCHPESFANRFLNFLKDFKLDYHFDWTSLVEKKIKIIDEGPFSYPKISKSLIDMLPESSTLYLGNSTVIRSFDSYCSLDKKKNLKIIHHRGVSGIEGFIAGSQGACEANEAPVTLVLGDVSFLHDLNSLMLLKDEKNPPIIIMVNNNGGGIFSLLPISKEEKVIPYLLTPHDFTFEQVSKQFNLSYKCVDQIDDLKENYMLALKKKTPYLLELKVDNDENVEIYKQLKTVKL